MEAAETGNAEMARYLLEQGADPDEKDDLGWTPLMKAAWRRDFPMVKLLVERGANVNARNLEGLSAFEYASVWRDSEIITALQAGIKKE